MSNIYIRVKENWVTSLSQKKTTHKTELTTTSKQKTAALNHRSCWYETVSFQKLNKIRKKKYIWQKKCLKNWMNYALQWYNNNEQMKLGAMGCQVVYNDYGECASVYCTYICVLLYMRWKGRMSTAHVHVICVCVPKAIHDFCSLAVCHLLLCVAVTLREKAFLWMNSFTFWMTDGVGVHVHIIIRDIYLCVNVASVCANASNVCIAYIA